MNRARLPLLIGSAALLAALLCACSPQDSSPAAASAKQEVSIPAISTRAKGFPVGSMMAANTAYVFFDPQCPHCGHLWEASVPLQNKLKFVWIPVSLINASSQAQGATLLSSANPQALMAEHEASLLAGKGGISASSSIAPDVEQSIKTNTQLLTSFGAESVPFIVAKNQRSGLTVSREGALGTPELAEFLGVDVGR